MKESYKVLGNGKVDVVDVENNRFIRHNIYDYQDNIEELLKAENIKEELENKKEEICNNINIDSFAINRNKDNNHLWISSSLIMFLIGVLIALKMESIQIFYVLIVMLSSIHIGAVLPNYLGTKSIKRDKFKNLCELDEIESELRRVKKIINKLEQDKTKEHEQEKNNNEYIKIDYINNLDSVYKQDNVKEDLIEEKGPILSKKYNKRNK